MSDLIYDTHNFVKRLNESGMPEKQAEVLAAENMHIMTEVLATKDDLRAVETTMVRQFADLRAEMDKLRAEMLAALAEYRAETKGEIASLRVQMASLENKFIKLESKVDSLESRLLIRLGGLIIAVQAAALVIGKLF